MTKGAQKQSNSSPQSPPKLSPARRPPAQGKVPFLKAPPDSARLNLARFSDKFFPHGVQALACERVWGCSPSEITATKEDDFADLKEERPAFFVETLQRRTFILTIAPKSGVNGDSK
jgi:hypothetical protein